MTRDLDALRDTCRLALQQIAHSFTKPDDDYEPAFHVCGPKHLVIAMLSDLQGPNDSDEARDRLATVLSWLMVRENAQAVAYISSAWMALRSETNPNLQLRPTDDPSRIEIVSLYVADPTRSYFDVAPILRDPGKPPMLGAWLPPSEGGGHYRGRHPEAIARGFRALATINALGHALELTPEKMDLHRRRVVDKMIAEQGIAMHSFEAKLRRYDRKFDA